MIRSILAAGFLLGAAGCATQGESTAKVAEGVRLGSYKRLGVMPFAGSSSQGDAIAEALAKRLFQMRFSVVYGRQLRAALSQLGVRRGDEIGAQTMRELARLTRIEALAIGSVDCGIRSRRARASALLVDASSGRILLESRFTPKNCGGRDAPDAIAAEVAGEIERALGREQKSAFEGAFGP